MKRSGTDRNEGAPARRRGSVLVFTVLLLVLLAGIGTAFVMFVNLEYAASGNALRYTQSRATAETGLEQARRAIREALLQYRFETPDGFFNLAGTTRPYIDEATGLYRFFEYHPGITTVAGADGALTNGVWTGRKDFAWLYWNDDPANCGVAALDGDATKTPPTPHTAREMTDHTYTESPLAHFAYPNGEKRQDRDNGIEHAGLARRFVVYSPVTDFYTADVSKAVSPYRGEYYIWVADLDAKLYAPHSGVTWGMTNASDVAEILKQLRSYGFSSGWGFDEASGTYKVGLTDPEIGLLAGYTGNFGSTDEVAAVLKRPVPDSGTSGVWEYLYYRHGLERYFTCRADEGNAVKVNETALNVNTASYEVLTAALSRIPLVDAGVGTPENLIKASYVAKRICAKRPFICRIDFEDFLAAHLNANPGAVENPKDGTVSPVPPARMVYLAIPKRQYTDAKELPAPVTPLSLSTLMETPVVETDARYTWLKNPLDQQSRFLWFRGDDGAAPLFTDATKNALLSTKAFNNILNSISGQIPGGGYGYSFYSYDAAETPFDGTTDGMPKIQYNELLDLISPGVDTYVVERGNLTSHDEIGELRAWRLTNNSGYYEMMFRQLDDAQVVQYLETRTTTTAGERVTFISGNGANEVPNLNNDLTDGDDVYEEPAAPGTTVTCDSTIHGPMRAYRFDYTASPEPVVTDADLAVNAGDLSWSPRFCFRSRFFKVYVLARSIVTLTGDQTPVYGPTSRLEAVYDAYEDKVLWRRWQSTELRRISDPVP